MSEMLKASKISGEKKLTGKYIETFTFAHREFIDKHKSYDVQ